MRRTARQAIDAGWVVARMNLRNCGGTEPLSTTLYNAGQEQDVGCVLAALDRGGAPRPLAVAGFSLGGNLVLLHAGRSADSCVADAVIAVNPPIELERCADAIEMPRNRVYQAYYVRRLCTQLRRIAAVRSVPGDPPVPAEIRTVRRFDDRYTAPDAGFDSAAAYYRASSAAPVLDAVRRPALIVSAEDDPFVPHEMFMRHHALPHFAFVHPAGGGHCGYIQSGRPWFWAAHALLGFLDSAPVSPRSSPTRSRRTIR
ncbi:MAG TPA: alpha/beta fold hydrolase, partial [Candidatus Polarisedimenticolaceae bacterium]|nr:alpha/beta fold hydrolase [Candidatus Polarisedimenticolaceae bacterium]